MSQELPSISPIELQAELNSPHPPTLIDVRELYELNISSIPQAVHIPMYELVSRMGQLDLEGNYVMMCRVGGRSAQATSYMMQSGFKHVRNLSEGINGWATQVDPTLTVY